MERYVGQEVIVIRKDSAEAKYLDGQQVVIEKIQEHEGRKYALVCLRKSVWLDELVEVKSYKKERRMNETVIKLYPQTADAVLVDKHLGKYFDNPLLSALCHLAVNPILEQAKIAEEKEKQEKANSVTK